MTKHIPIISLNVAVLALWIAAISAGWMSVAWLILFVVGSAWMFYAGWMCGATDGVNRTRSHLLSTYNMYQQHVDMRNLVFGIEPEDILNDPPTRRWAEWTGDPAPVDSTPTDDPINDAKFASETATRAGANAFFSVAARAEDGRAT